MPVESKKNPLIPQDDRLYPTQVRTEAERVTELTVRGDQSLERSNDRANSEIQRLRVQARMLMEQAENVETEARIQAKIRNVKFRFDPVVNQEYFLYEKNGQYMMSLIGPDEWKGEAPFGVCLARVKQLSDLTWEIKERSNHS